MTEYYVVSFASTHDAIAAESRFLEEGIPVKIIPLPSQIAAGCGLALRFSPDIYAESITILRDGRFARLFRVTGDQDHLKYEEMDDAKGNSRP